MANPFFKTKMRRQADALARQIPTGKWFAEVGAIPG
jgi:hypothetical protein